jgi:hypothetical protein
MPDITGPELHANAGQSPGRLGKRHECVCAGHTCRREQAKGQEPEFHVVTFGS